MPSSVDYPTVWFTGASGYDALSKQKKNNFKPKCKPPIILRSYFYVGPLVPFCEIPVKVVSEKLEEEYRARNNQRNANCY